MVDNVYRDDVKAIMDEMLDMPGVKAGKSWGYPSYSVNKRIFLFVTDGGIAVKLPPTRVQQLADTQENAALFEVGERVTWKSWVLIGHDDADDYFQYHALLQESIEFVAATSA